nr:ribonuclease H-like domain, reverse transcriptase, RNA-dependent DNA polymerase [Tanacetum cinerariifolium]
MKRTGRDHDGRVIILPPTTAEEHIAVQKESKARTTLLQSILDDHMRKSMLKQEFSKFRIGKEEGLHKGYDRMQKILSQLNQLKAKPDDEDINLKFLRALPSSWSQVALTLKTKGGLELLSFDDLYYKLKTLEVDVKGYNTFSSSQYARPSHSAFVSATSASKNMSYGDSLNYSLTTTYCVPSNSNTRSHRSGNAIEKGVAKIYNLITGADTEEASTASDTREFALMVFTSDVRNCPFGCDNKYNELHKQYNELNEQNGRPIFPRFAKADSMKAVPLPLSEDYTSLSDHIDWMNHRCLMSSEVHTNDFASSDSSVKSFEPKLNDSTSCASTSSVSIYKHEAEIESNVGTPIQEPIIVQDLPSLFCNSSDKNENTSRTSYNKNGYFNKKAGHFRKNASSVSKLGFVCGSGTHLIKDYDFYEKQMANKTVGIGVGPMHYKNKVNYQNQFVPQAVLLRNGKVNIPHARPQPVPTGKLKLFAPVPAGRQNRSVPVPTDRGYSPSVNFDRQLLLNPQQVVLGNHIEKVYTGYQRTIVDLIHLHTDANVADLLTKAFDGPRFNHLMVIIRMLNPYML